ncbi:hypothetical protein CWS72_12740 [Telmatospirillum siberiense]|uniref:Hemerythrin-like domain-containing protein n=2 Tax=Telmatospirillum siberiense TaxID=382514 RepID=A0A2N3PUX6_9PROT|nr:hypothetical protein CWS72_12740 [Telmatospirillum siberiense]
MIMGGLQDLADRLDEIVQIWRLGAETSILGERLSAFRQQAEIHFDQEVGALADASDGELLQFTASYDAMMRKIDAVLADFAAGGGASLWFDMAASIERYLRYDEAQRGLQDIALSRDEENAPRESLIGWTRDLALGVDWIDQHHRALIDTINEIGLLPRHYDLVDADALLERLRRIAWHHFHEEEAHLALGDRERARRHVAQHRYLLADLDRLIFDVRSRRADLTGETSDRLCRWLIDHILTIDKEDFQSLQR